MDCGCDLGDLAVWNYCRNAVILWGVWAWSPWGKSGAANMKMEHAKWRSWGGQKGGMLRSGGTIKILIFMVRSGQKRQHPKWSFASDLGYNLRCRKDGFRHCLIDLFSGHDCGALYDGDSVILQGQNLILFVSHTEHILLSLSSIFFENFFVTWGDRHDPLTYRKDHAKDLKIKISRCFQDNHDRQKDRKSLVRYGKMNHSLVITCRCTRTRIKTMLFYGFIT